MAIERMRNNGNLVISLLLGHEVEGNPGAYQNFASFDYNLYPDVLPKGGTPKLLKPTIRETMKTVFELTAFTALPNDIKR